MEPNNSLPDAPGRLEHELTRRGVRLTRQRRAILATIEGAGRHLDAAQILRWSRRIEPDIDRVTVYRTLGMLKRHGLIDELDLMHVTGEAHYYEPRPTGDHEHVHVTCLHCGGVIEFESEHLALLRAEVEKTCAFRVTVARTEIGGCCQECARTGKPTATRRHRGHEEAEEDE